MLGKPTTMIDRAMLLLNDHEDKAFMTVTQLSGDVDGHHPNLASNRTQRGNTAGTWIIQRNAREGTSSCVAEYL